MGASSNWQICTQRAHHKGMICFAETCPTRNAPMQSVERDSRGYPAVSNKAGLETFSTIKTYHYLSNEFPFHWDVSVFSTAG